MLPDEHRTFAQLFLVMMVIIVMGFLLLLQVPWSPKYPIVAKLKYHPDLLTVPVPENGIIEAMNVHVGEMVQQGQKLVKIDSMSNLIASNYYQQKRKNYLEQIRKLEIEKDYQIKRNRELAPLYAKKIITESLMHRQRQKENELQTQIENIKQKLSQMNHARWIWIQSPISGKLLFLYYSKHDVAQKGKKLLLIQPTGIQYWVNIQVLPKYQKILYLHQKVKLALPRMNQFSDYPLEARVKEIAPMVHLNIKKPNDNQGESYLLVHAKIKNSKILERFLLPNMPLNGYLIGENKSLFQWMKTMWLMM
jgi:biotin carboxyl carrier protein